jgi:hypothetical protein
MRAQGWEWRVSRTGGCDVDNFTVALIPHALNGVLACERSTILLSLDVLLGIDFELLTMAMEDRLISRDLRRDIARQPPLPPLALSL